MSELEFDEGASRRLESMYLIKDAVHRRELVRGAIGAAPGERVLDVGCGPGFYCAELADDVGQDGSVVGIDDSPSMLALARKRCDGMANVAFLAGNAVAVPVEDGTFDAAICVQVMEYVPDTAAGLAGLHRTLRPGGRVLVWDIDWAATSLNADDPALAQRVLDAWDEHLVHRSLPRTLGSSMRAAGFDNVQMQAHAFATNKFDPDAYGCALVPFIAAFVRGRNGLSDDEVATWVAEQRALGERDEFFVSITQFCFTATKP